MHSFFNRRFGTVYLLTLLFLGIALLIRFALLLHTVGADLSPGTAVTAFAIGALYDLITASYFFIPLIIYLTVLPERAFRNRWQRRVLQLGVLLTLYLLLFVAVAEWVFWDEFESRFNFIAVDYLVYTNEVIGNIRESYPIPALLTAIGVATALVFLLVRRFIMTEGPHTTLPQRLRHATLLLAVPIAATLTVDNSMAAFSGNRYANELAGDGIYSFFAAFRNNQLDYTRYYAVREEQPLFKHLHELLAEPGTRFVSDDPMDITRRIVGRGPEKRLNVVLITVESLSAEYLGIFGSNTGATPFLDALSHEGLLFTNLYATGTRTDRGLEAITLSVPPTPGRSIVKRPNNENMFSLGQVFRAHDYTTEFLYGGYGYFDNMNDFFAHNGFETIDRNDLAPEDIHFANVWGVADEDLFTKTLSEIDRTHATGKPFFGLVMTTSNHRPYTYPDGRIDIPSPGGRTGVVKYTDYAIHDFIERARSKPWFDDTLFIVVADHCGKSAGRDALTAASYHIPMLIYSPKHIAPGRYERLASQIDVAPTLLGQLNFSYDSRFYGRDVLAPEPMDNGRALIGNYQKLGYLKDGELTVLSPRQQLTSYVVNAGGRQKESANPKQEFVEDTIAFYESASLLFQRGLNHYP